MTDVMIQMRFNQFHETNPHVYREIIELARRAKNMGYQRWSMNGVFEVMRWNKALRTKGESWKLNNSFRALYARMVMDEILDLEGFFEIREHARVIQ